MHPADVKAALEKRGWTLANLGRELGVTRTAMTQTLHFARSQRIEQAIAAKIGLLPVDIWPDRYPKPVPPDTKNQQVRKTAA